MFEKDERNSKDSSLLMEVKLRGIMNDFKCDYIHSDFIMNEPVSAIRFGLEALKLKYYNTKIETQEQMEEVDDKVNEINNILNELMKYEGKSMYTMSEEEHNYIVKIFDEI